MVGIIWKNLVSSCGQRPSILRQVRWRPRVCVCDRKQRVNLAIGTASAALVMLVDRVCVCVCVLACLLHDHSTPRVRPEKNKCRHLSRLMFSC